LLSLLVFFVLAALHDLAATWWLDLKDEGKHWQASLMAMGIEALQWATVLVAITEENLMIAVAAVAGSGVGTWLGLKRRRQETPA
jgi:hypothetical protein